MNPVINLDISKGESQVQAFVDKGKPFRKSFKVSHTLEGLSLLVEFLDHVQKETGQKPPTNKLSAVLSELQLTKHLRKAGIRKTFGFSCTYLFQLVFCLTFHQKNWFTLVTSRKNDSFTGKFWYSPFKY
ncbi:hypothetical protein JMM81_13260 [Bacillus sp. V3B]|uniref:hypothetical protein n=1 Tax=Bacillus sp. V3B TaxID=2804915 RepID=UPI00210AAA9E|nr:hypothetical protein [Bacillus sp. V3B]MCQ6275915.1 hypothetical protein [Bacillus sp. V3B]